MERLGYFSLQIFYKKYSLSYLSHLYHKGKRENRKNPVYNQNILGSFFHMTQNKNSFSD